MSALEPTFPQATHALKLIDDQELNHEQMKMLHLCLPILSVGIKENMFNQDILQATLVAKRAKVKHVIDFDKPPSIPKGSKILGDSEQLPNRVKGIMEYDPAKVAVYLAKDQRKGISMTGFLLFDALKDMSGVYGAQLLDFYYAQPHLIPRGWPEVLCFWGTLYSDQSATCYVRYLYRSGDRWFQAARPIALEVPSNYPAVIA